MQIKLIFISKVLYEASLWKGGTRLFENGLFLSYIFQLASPPRLDIN